MPNERVIIVTSIKPKHMSYSTILYRDKIYSMEFVERVEVCGMIGVWVKDQEIVVSGDLMACEKSAQGKCDKSISNDPIQNVQYKWKCCICDSFFMYTLTK